MDRHQDIIMKHPRTRLQHSTPKAHFATAVPLQEHLHSMKYRVISMQSQLTCSCMCWPQTGKLQMIKINT